MSDLPDDLRTMLSISPEQVYVVPKNSKINIEDISIGVVFIMDYWSFQSRESFRRLMQYLKVLEYPSDAKLYIVDNSSVARQEIVSELGVMFHGCGETLWIRCGKILRCVTQGVYVFDIADIAAWIDELSSSEPDAEMGGERDGPAL